MSRKPRQQGDTKTLDITPRMLTIFDNWERGVRNIRADFKIITSGENPDGQPSQMLRFYRRIDMNNIRDGLCQLAIEVGTMTPYINSGGCCVLAGLVGEALQWHNVGHRIRVHSWNAEENAGALLYALDTVRNVHDKKEWADNGVIFNHVLVDVDGYGLYDGSGFHADTYTMYEGALSFYEAQELSKLKHGWNASFRRELIPSLINAVENCLHVPRLLRAHEIDWEY